MRKILTVCSLLLVSLAAGSQEFRAFGLFGEGKPMKLNGGFNSTVLYNYSKDSAATSNLTYVVGGNLTLYVAGISVPFSFAYSNAQVSASFQPIPFNKLAFHPRYKNITLHLGTVSSTFSPYTLNAMQYTGAGVDVMGSKLKVSVVGGSFLKGSGDFAQNPEGPVVFSRKGYGAMIGYQLTDNIELAGNFFYAKEDSSSAFHIPSDQQATPKQNMVVGLKTRMQLFSKLNIASEYAASYMTNDLRSQLAYNQSSGGFKSFIANNGTTTAKNAFNVNLGYTIQTVDIGFQYEKVDVDYNTLGSLFILNGFENSAFSVAFPLFKNKVFLSGKLGIQNDLNDSVFSQSSGRLLTGFTASINAIPKLSINASLNNTQGITNFRNLNNISSGNNLVPYYLDSLRSVQVNFNSSLNVNYMLSSSKSMVQSLNGAYSLQKGTQKQGDFFLNEQGNSFQNASLNFSTVYPQTTMQWSLSSLYTRVGQSSDSIITNAYGVNTSLGKKFSDKTFGVVIGAGYNTSRTPLTFTTINVANFKLQMNYVYKKRHNFVFSGIFQTKENVNAAKNISQGSTNIVCSLNYNYSF